MSLRKTIPILIHEHAVYERDTKWKKTYLTSIDNITMWLYRSLAELNTTSLLFKEQMLKRS